MLERVQIPSVGIKGFTRNRIPFLGERHPLQLLESSFSSPLNEILSFPEELISKSPETPSLASYSSPDVLYHLGGLTLPNPEWCSTLLTLTVEVGPDFWPNFPLRSTGSRTQH